MSEKQCHAASATSTLPSSTIHNMKIINECITIIISIIITSIDIYVLVHRSDNAPESWRKRDRKNRFEFTYCLVYNNNKSNNILLNNRSRVCAADFVR